MVVILIFVFSACKQDEKSDNAQADSISGTSSFGDTGSTVSSRNPNGTNSFSGTGSTVASRSPNKTNSYNEGGNTNNSQANTEDNPTNSRTKLPKVSEYTDRLDDTLKVRRSMLNNTEKQLYDKLLPYVLSYTPFTIDYKDMGYKLESLQKALNAIRHDYPEIWLYFTLGLDMVTVERDGEYGVDVVSCSSRYFYLEYTKENMENFNKKNISDYISRIDNACDSILAQMPNGLSTKEKYIWIADYLCLITEYDYEDTNDFLYADGPILYGKGICQSYAFAYQWLCQKAGLWCMLCNGMSGGIGHCWNVVRLDDGKTYYMDLTWADGSNNPNNHYFMSYAKCTQNRTIDEGEWIADGQ